MKREFCLACSQIGLVLTLLMSSHAQAQLELVYDVNQTGSQLQSLPTQFTAVNGTVIFVATGPEGRELWKTNGTTAGTTLLKDIRPGNLGSEPKILAVRGTFAYFAANDGVHGTELWKTDGTAANTVLVKDVFPGAGSGNPLYAIAHAGLVFFTAQDYDRNYELWKTDGTEAGTAMVQDIQSNSVNPGSGPNNFISLGNTLLFTATTDAYGSELWKTDATGSGITLVKDIIPGSSSGSFQQPVAMGGNVYFGGSDSTHGYELWKTDGTDAGTVMVKDIYTGAGNSGGPSGGMVVVSNNTLYFSATDSYFNRELWKSDGTEAGTVLVKEIRPGTGNFLGSDPYGFKVVGTQVYFLANDGTTGIELWKTDGTAVGTVQVKDLAPGTASGARVDDPYTPPVMLEVIGSNVYFYGTSGTATGGELWKTDGTAANTAMVKELAPGPAHAVIREMKAIGSLLYFSAAEPSGGYEPYVSDGTAGNTGILKNIGTGTASSNPASLTPANGKLYFSANDGVNGREVWVTDGVDTHLTRVTNTTNTDSAISIGALNGTAYFGAATAPNDDSQLWRSDGTNMGTYPVSQTGVAIPGGITYRPAGNLMFFTAYSTGQGEELWRTDGTAAGTFLLKDSVAGTDSSRFGEWAAIGNILYYVCDAPNHTQQLFRSDGTLAGTRLVKDYGVFADPYSFCPLGNTLYLSIDGPVGNELYKSDGTAAGTVLVKDVNPDGSSFAALTTPINSTTMLFTALNAVYNNSIGTELWKTDGTAAGTKLVKDINPGYRTGSYPRALVERADGAFTFAVINGVAYFSADDGSHGRELWRSDGTEGGTYMVKDIVPDGITGSDPSSMVVLGDKLYFIVTISGGTQLWTSDGTALGTVMVDDHVTDITNVVVSGTNLYVVGSQAAVGTELFRLANVRTAPFTITQSPAPATQTVAPGATVAFTVATTGETPSYQWRRNGIIIPGATKTTYSFKASEALEGNYDVLMRSGDFELISDAAQVFATDPLKVAITQQPVARLAKVFDAITFKVSAVGQTLAYQWYKGTVPINGATTSTLSLPFAFAADAGLYKVKVSNSLGSVFSAAVPLVLVGSTTTTVPVKSLTTAVMKAPIFGAVAGVTYLWHSGGALANGGLNNRLSGVTTPTLSLAKFTTSDQYNFNCVVYMGTQSVISGVIAPRVASVPIIVAKPTPPTWIISGDVFQFASGSLFTQTNFSTTNAATIFSITGLPLGMTYDPKTGLITGRPKAGGGTSVALKIKVGNVAGTMTTTLTVNVPVEVYPALAKGAFRGLADRSATTLNDNLGDYLQVDITALGSLSGKLFRGTTAYPFTTRYVDTVQGSTMATAAVNIARPGTTALTLNLVLDGSTGAMTGNLTDGTNTTPVICARSPWIAAGVGAMPATAYAKAYTAALQLLASEGHVGDAAYPQGDGYAVASVTTAGAVTGAVRLADSTKITFSTLLGAMGELPLHVGGYTNTGSFHGWSQITSATGNWDGTDSFFKAPQPLASTTRSYKGGVPLHTLTLVGGPWVKPTPLALLLGVSDTGAVSATNNAGILFTQGGIDSSGLAVAGVFDTSLRIKAPASSFVLPPALPATGKLSLSSASLLTGEITGSFTTTGTGVRGAPYYGVIVQRLNKGRGHFNLAKLPDVGQPNALKTDILSGLVELVKRP